MPSTQLRKSGTPAKDWYRPFGFWIGLTFGLGLIAIATIEVSHGAWLDVCDAFHEPPTTLLGISVAVLATGVPLVFAICSRFRQLVLIALMVAVFEGLVFWWLFTPQGTC